MLFVAACGTAPPLDDAASGPMLDAPVTCVARATVTPAHLHAGVLTTFAGRTCIVAGCHLPNMTGTGALGFQFAGTVYTQDGQTPQQGVTVQLNPDVGEGASAITDSAGSFFMLDGTLLDPFPGHAQTTACPTIAVMPETLTAGTNDCNSPACHAVAGAMPIRM